MILQIGKSTHLQWKRKHTKCRLVHVFLTISRSERKLHTLIRMSTEWNVDMKCEEIIQWPSTDRYEIQLAAERKTTSVENGIFIRMFPLINDLFRCYLSFVRFRTRARAHSLQFNGFQRKTNAFLYKYDFKSGHRRVCAREIANIITSTTTTSCFGHVSHAFATAHSNLWTCCPLNFLSLSQ